MRKPRWGFWVLFFAAIFSQAQQRSETSTRAKSSHAIATSDSPVRLPVRRVVLYKNGVGYFEHSAKVRGNQELGIDFTTAQLNDVLKSLTVMDLGQGHISGIRYNSIAPLEERLKALRLPFGERITRTDFLSALRGARVEVRSKSETAVGRLLSVEQEDRTTDAGTYHATLLSVVTDTGEMRNFELTPALSVRLAEQDLGDEVRRYLNLIASSRARDLRRMTISATGSGEREVFVSYISEVPVWKSTYRIILPENADEKPVLQGWAIVDNTIGEDWNAVELSLIAGSPQSFIQDISQPLYARRPVVNLPQLAMLTPQTQEATLKEEEAPPPAMPGGTMGGGMSGPAALPLMPLTTATNGLAYEQADRIQSKGRAQAYDNLETAAESKDLGDYFEYDLKQTITIGKNQSALVPILESRIQAEKVTLWTANGNRPPLRAIWVKNASLQTLDSGTFNIIDRGTFAGEGLLATVHPDERRLLSYAADTAVRITSESEAKDKPISRIQILKGVIFVSRERRNTVKYTIHNSDTLAREVIIEHPVREGWKLVARVKPEETSQSYYRLRVRLDAGKTKELTVEEFHPDVTRYMLSDLTDNQAEILLTDNVMSEELRDAFRLVLNQKNKISELETRIESCRQELESIMKDQGRIRENMKALKGSAEEKALLERYAHQLGTQEDRLASLNKQRSELLDTQAAERQKLQTMVEHITLD